MSRRPGPERAVLDACLAWRRAEIREAAIRMGIIAGAEPDPAAPERELARLRVLIEEMDAAKREAGS